MDFEVVLGGGKLGILEGRLGKIIKASAFPSHQIIGKSRPQAWIFRAQGGGFGLTLIRGGCSTVGN
jgi:hypothetical protein